MEYTFNDDLKELETQIRWGRWLPRIALAMALPCVLSALIVHVQLFAWVGAVTGGLFALTGLFSLEVSILGRIRGAFHSDVVWERVPAYPIAPEGPLWVRWVGAAAAIAAGFIPLVVLFVPAILFVEVHTTLEVVALSTWAAGFIGYGLTQAVGSATLVCPDYLVLRSGTVVKWADLENFVSDDEQFHCMWGKIRISLPKFHMNDHCEVGRHMESRIPNHASTFAV